MEKTDSWELQGTPMMTHSTCVLMDFETKEFAIYSVLPEDRIPGNVYLYAESDQSSMVHLHYNPLILKNIIDHEGRHATDPKKPTSHICKCHKHIAGQS